MTSKVCTTCKKLKPVEAFARAGMGREKQQLYKARCKECTNALMRDDRMTSPRNHHENVVRDRCPHGGGIRRVSVPGWGYAP